MTRFFTSLAFCLALLIAGAFFLAPRSAAREDLISALLGMPAPPPPNPLMPRSAMTSERLADKKNPPADDAPIGELMEYWRFQSSGFRDLGYNILPSPRSLDRIRAEIEKDPASITGFINIMRDSRDGADFVKRMYDNWPAGSEERNEGREGVKEWLAANSPYFSEQLVKTANRAGDRNEYVSNQVELLALAKYNWDAIRPTVDRLYGDSGQPVSRVLATWALYRHSLAEGLSGDTDRYRDELKAVVEDKKATPGMRDLAFDALVKEPDWSGRDEWYYSLLEDETLGDLRVGGASYTGLTTIIMYSPPEKYQDKMIELVKSTNLTVRNAAARNLAIIADREHPDAVRALLPWLEDPKWARDTGGERQRLVSILQSLKMPECVPGLIAMLDEKEMQEFPVREVPSAAYSSDRVANAMNTAVAPMRSTSNANSSYSVRTIAIARHPYRDQAIRALGVQADPRAAPVLRRLLYGPEEEYERGQLVTSLLMCKGFTVTEQADALEALAKTSPQDITAVPYTMSNTMSNAYMMRGNAYSGPWGDPDGRRGDRPTVSTDGVKLMLGSAVAQISEPGDALVREVVARISLLEKNDPPTAERLRSVILNWNGTAVNALLLKDLRDGKSSADAVLKLLTVRKELREKQSAEVADIRSGNPTAVGIAACLLDNEADYSAVFGGENTEAKAALFACARLIRAKISVHEAAKYLSSSDKRLAKAAELYLESEDSPEARSVVLSLHPDGSKILGATTAFWPADNSRAMTPQLVALFASFGSDGPAFASFGSPGAGTDSYAYVTVSGLNDLEKRLQKEIKDDSELFGIYSYTDNFVRIYRDRAVYSWEEDASRYRERNLTKDEFEGLTAYLAHYKVDELPPFLNCRGGCDSQELLMLGRAGGRRVYVSSPSTPEFFAGLETIFTNMRSAPAKLHYALEKDVPGLEILFADDERSAQTVWKNGSDLRLLVADNVRRKEIDREIADAVEALEDADSEEPAEENENVNPRAEDSIEQKRWELQQKREFDNFGWFKLQDGHLADAVPQPDQVGFLPVHDGLSVAADSEQWKAKAAGVELRTGPDGLYKIAAGRMTKLQDGNFSSAVITSNGRWAVATKYDDEEGAKVVRIDLASNKVTPVVSPQVPTGHAVVFVPSVNKVLIALFNGEDEEVDEDELSSSDYAWLDAETGSVLPVKGEVRPLTQQKFRSLQPAGAPFEFWAAISDREKNTTRVGTYNSKTFAFKTVATIPKITFNSMDMWIDEAANKIYFVYSGHLLSLPLPVAARRV